MRLGPIAFLFAVAATWALARSIMLWPQRPEPAGADRRLAWAAPLERAAVARSIAAFEPRARSLPTDGRNRIRARGAAAPGGGVAEPARAIDRPRPAPARPAAAPTLPAAPSPPVPLGPRRGDRLSLSAWALVRGDAAPGLAAASQLGGSQAGLRARWRVAHRVHVAARVSGPLQTGRGKEAAIAIDVQPLHRLPLTITAERRVAIDRGGRNAFALGLVGGLARDLPAGLRLDGYAQAGLVGLRRRDAYVDGLIRVERGLIARPAFGLAAGAGAWGAAQPGAARLDLGPQLAIRLPVAAGALRIAAEWRQRVAGQARPGSGPVLSLGADF